VGVGVLLIPRMGVTGAAVSGLASFALTSGLFVPLWAVMEVRKMASRCLTQEGS
jgi:hypothetical protein